MAICLLLFLILGIQVIAGSSWIVKTLSLSDGSVDRIMFIDELTGWACAYFPGVLKTDNGGDTWVILYSNRELERIFSVWFVTRQVGWAVGTSFVEKEAHPVILYTENAGRFWTIQKLLEERWQLRDIYFIDEKYGWAVGGANHDALILATADGGRHWEIQHQGPDNSPLGHVRFADFQTGWAVGINIILHTSDGGQTWTPQRQSPDPWLNGLCVLDKDNLWATGGEGRLYRTINGGNNWSRATLPTEANKAFLWDIAFVNNNKGWVCGDKGVLLSTEDGGRTWRKVSTPVDDEMLRAIATTKSRLFIAADPNRILIKSQ